jgi:hypothetical protein
MKVYVQIQLPKAGLTVCRLKLPLVVAIIVNK